MDAIEKHDDMLGLIEDLRKADLGSLRYSLQKLDALMEWTLVHVGVTYRVGDRVEIIAPVSIDRQSGWWPYRECLAVGATATVREIDFNSWHKCWQTGIVLDREWSVGSDGKQRFWSGPIADAPEGFTTSKHDEDRKSVFHYPAMKLRKYEGGA